MELERQYRDWSRARADIPGYGDAASQVGRTVLTRGTPQSRW